LRHSARGESGSSETSEGIVIDQLDGTFLAMSHTGVTYRHDRAQLYNDIAKYSAHQ
jgi:hypothetical protein